MIRIGVIGCDHWGANLVRNCFETPGAKVVCVGDLRPDRLAILSSRYPSVKTILECRELIEDPSIDTVAIATPVSPQQETDGGARLRAVEVPQAASQFVALRRRPELRLTTLQTTAPPPTK